MDGGWVKILEQKTWVFFALGLFFGGGWLFLDRGLLPDLKIAYPWSKDAALAGALLFVCLATISSIRAIASWVSGFFEERASAKLVLSRLDHLSQIEHTILSYLTQSEQQSFKCRIDNGDVSLLIQKNLVFRASGQHNILEWPHYIPDRVWLHLQKNKEQFASADPHDPEPWARHWMA